jgi:hypothetical protein
MGGGVGAERGCDRRTPAPRPHPLHPSRTPGPSPSFLPSLPHPVFLVCVCCTSVRARVKNERPPCPLPLSVQRVSVCVCLFYSFCFLRVRPFFFFLHVSSWRACVCVRGRECVARARRVRGGEVGATGLPPLSPPASECAWFLSLSRPHTPRAVRPSSFLFFFFMLQLAVCVRVCGWVFRQSVWGRVFCCFFCYESRRERTKKTTEARGRSPPSLTRRIERRCSVFVPLFPWHARTLNHRPSPFSLPQARSAWPTAPCAGRAAFTAASFARLSLF